MIIGACTCRASGHRRKRPSTNTSLLDDLPDEAILQTSQLRLGTGNCILVDRTKRVLVCGVSRYEKRCAGSDQCGHIDLDLLPSDMLLKLGRRA
jgi:hypothetical protein